jgi:hypothetical protein
MTDATNPQYQTQGQDPQAGTTQAAGAGAAVQTGAGAATGGAGATEEKQYNIPDTVKRKYPELVEMIKKTESMSDEERDYWFQILPIMTDDQVKRLRDILEEEAAQLAKLDEQYQDELSRLNKKHLEEWDDFERRQKREELEAKEAEAEAEEAAAEEDLLGALDDV